MRASKSISAFNKDGFKSCSALFAARVAFKVSFHKFNVFHLIVGVETIACGALVKGKLFANFVVVQSVVLLTILALAVVI